MRKALIHGGVIGAIVAFALCVTMLTHREKKAESPVLHNRQSSGCTPVGGVNCTANCLSTSESAWPCVTQTSGVFNNTIINDSTTSNTHAFAEVKDDGSVTLTQANEWAQVSSSVTGSGLISSPTIKDRFSVTWQQAGGDLQQPVMLMLLKDAISGQCFLMATTLAIGPQVPCE